MTRSVSETDCARFAHQPHPLLPSRKSCNDAPVGNAGSGQLAYVFSHAAAEVNWNGSS